MCHLNLNLEDREIYDELVEILILAVIQGVTEWLPLSSSGHLAIAQRFFDLQLSDQAEVAFDVLLHVGTMCVVLLTFRKDVVNILNALAHHDFEREEGKLAIFIIVGSIPTTIIGFVFQKFFESLFFNPPAVGVALVATGCFLFISERRKTGKKLGCVDSLLIGTAQGVAIIPGVSRSGATIATGLLRKVKREKVFRYSFLLSVPAVLGATVVKSRDLVTANIDMIPLFIGALTSMVVGYVSLKLLSKIVMKKKFHVFAYYCWMTGFLVVGWSFLR
ncbi:MAG: undecaprenyl-diphosphate phosphatase [Thermoproteota archaeon]|nr:undecaprenyl-diphosphate phosphatase [Thermoproteota archaeon]